MDLNFQYAHHSHDEFESKLNVSLGEAIEAFDKFDWDGEVKRSKELKKCSPTLSLIINGHSEMVWVSGIGEENSVEFVSECFFPGEVSKWFGLSKSQGVVSLHNGSFTRAQAKKAIELLVAKNYDGLRDLYA